MKNQESGGFTWTKRQDPPIPTKPTYPPNNTHNGGCKREYATIPDANHQTTHRKPLSKPLHGSVAQEEEGCDMDKGEEKEEGDAGEGMATGVGGEVVR